MRIYYKKKFWAGVGALLLGLALPGTCLFVGWERFDLKDAVLTMFMVLSGISGILRSLDREKARQDRDEDRDERTRTIRGMAAYRALVSGTPIFLTVWLILLFLDVPLAGLLVVCAGYLLNFGVYAYHLVKLQKEM